MLDTFFGTEDNSASYSKSLVVPLTETQSHPSSVFKSSATMGRLPTKRGEFYGHITLVDAGMVAQLDEIESRNFVGLLVAIGEGDGRAAADVVLGFFS